MDPARQLFEEFMAGGFAFLQQAIDEEWAEHPLLDFKVAAKGSGPMMPDDRETLAEALSGFNWSDGGVIVWGVDCRSHGPDDPDTAKELRPIGNLRRFVSDLHRYTAELVSPGIVGGEHFAVEDPADATSGYVVTYVPKSQGVPSMARAKGQHRYYYRSGSSFRMAEPFMIADRFSRRPQPRLEFTWRLASSGREHNRVTILIVLGIRNTGVGIALYPAITIAGIPCWHYGVDSNRNPGLPARPLAYRSDSGRTFAGGVDDAIHPGTTPEVTCAIVEVPVEGPVPGSTKFRYELHCDGFSDSGEVEVPAEQIERERDAALH
jgi:hypothetical protein